MPMSLLMFSWRLIAARGFMIVLDRGVSDPWKSVNAGAEAGAEAGRGILG